MIESALRISPGVNTLCHSCRMWPSGLRRRHTIWHVRLHGRHVCVGRAAARLVSSLFLHIRVPDRPSTAYPFVWGSHRYNLLQSKLEPFNSIVCGYVWRGLVVTKHRTSSSPHWPCKHGWYHAQRIFIVRQTELIEIDWKRNYKDQPTIMINPCFWDAVLVSGKLIVIFDKNPSGGYRTNGSDNVGVILNTVPGGRAKRPSSVIHISLFFRECGSSLRFVSSSATFTSTLRVAASLNLIRRPPPSPSSVPLPPVSRSARCLLSWTSHRLLIVSGLTVVNITSSRYVEHSLKISILNSYVRCTWAQLKWENVN